MKTWRMRRERCSDLLTAFIVICAAGVSTVNGASCPARNDVGNCSCNFLHATSGGGGLTKTEILAAVTGILSPMIIGGSAFGIWKFIQFKKQGPQFERTPSDLSRDSYDEARNRKGYVKNNGKVTPSRDGGDSDMDNTYARPYSNPLSLSGDSEYGFDDSAQDTPLTQMDQTYKRVSPTNKAPPRGIYNNPGVKSDGLNNWMF